MTGHPGPGRPPRTARGTAGAAALALLASLAAAGPGAAQDMETGQEIYQQVCKNCHGPSGKGMASFPNLVDSEAEHLTMRLEQYRAQERVGPNSPLMWPLAEELSDEEIASIVLYVKEGI